MSRLKRFFSLLALIALTLARFLLYKSYANSIANFCELWMCTGTANTITTHNPFIYSYSMSNIKK